MDNYKMIITRIWSRATRIGITGSVLRADIKHIQLCTIIAYFMILTNLISIGIGGFIMIVSLSSVPFYAFTIVLNRFGRFLSARIYLGILGIVVMIIQGIFLPGIYPASFMVVAIFLHFFLYPTRYRHIMYIHAVILILLYIFFAIIDVGRTPPIAFDQEYLEFARFGYLILIPFFAAIPCVFIYISFWKAEDNLNNANAKNEELLLNILPESIADRLKDRREPIADYFEEATILFADIVNFTELSGSIPPEELVILLDNIFAGFDEIADRYSLEKIKTIGDAYMVAGGIPEKKDNHCEAVADMALAMQEFITQNTHNNLSIRIGIHTGPVIAGVIGRKKFIYDMWGDSVNTASRMESHGIKGQIQVTDEVVKKLGETFNFEPRGSIEIKGKGTMTTYFLIDRK